MGDETEDDATPTPYCEDRQAACLLLASLLLVLLVAMLLLGADVTECKEGSCCWSCC